MAITDKPTALQTDKEVTTSMFESFLTPEEDKVEDAVTETEEVVEEEPLYTSSLDFFFAKSKAADPPKASTYISESGM